ncbi:MAG: hypothetical protein R3C10_22170 [Pirellulales bacterium]
MNPGRSGTIETREGRLRHAAAIYIAAAFAALVGLMTVDGQTHTQPATETTVATKDEPLAVRHAQAAAELASVELAIAEQLNARVPAAVPASEAGIGWRRTPGCCSSGWR